MHLIRYNKQSFEVNRRAFNIIQTDFSIFHIKTSENFVFVVKNPVIDR